MAEDQIIEADERRRFPLLLPNIRKILGASGDQEVANALNLHRSNISKWDDLGRVGLYHCSPFLKVMTFEELALQDVTGTINENRGWTRDPAVACKGPGLPGPVLMRKEIMADGALARIRFMLGFDNDTDEVNTLREIVERRGRSWKARRTVPDYIYHSIAESLRVSITYLLMGGDDEAEASKMRERCAPAPAGAESQAKEESDDREPRPQG